MPAKIQFLKGDITEMAVDAVVNAANTALQMEGGVAAAIRTKGGERIQEECEALAPVRLGAAVVTSAGNLKANFVIHAATMRPKQEATAESIRLATRACLMRAEEKALRSIAFSALGAGATSLSPAESAAIMLKAVREHIQVRTTLERIYFVLPDDATLQVFQEAYEKAVTSDK